MKFLAKIFLAFFYVFVRAEWREMRVLLKALEKPSGRNRLCPRVAQELLISGEDHRFFAHLGIDFIAIFRACYRGFLLGKPEGASTIEMQIVRVVSGRYERTLRRKIREMALAVLLSKHTEKHRLPAIYLRIGYFGWRMHGFASTAKRLGLSTTTISEMDAARIVARLKYPQPRATSHRRQRQIETRARHLCGLRNCHQGEQRYSQLHTPSNATV